MEMPEYRYHVSTWGGFYNEEYQKVHGLKEGGFIFNIKQERDSFIASRREIEKELGARHLAFSLSEGFCCGIETVLHRVIEAEGKRYYSKRVLGVNYPFDAAENIIEYKWYPGFNDYPLGEDYDYSKVKVIQEWITGADTIKCGGA